MLVGEGQVKPFDGDMKDYYKYILEVKKAENNTSNIAVQSNNDSKNRIENYLLIRESNLSHFKIKSKNLKGH